MPLDSVIVGAAIKATVATAMLACTVLMTVPMRADAADKYAYFEDGVARVNAGDYKGALVQLKNALQQDPGHLPSRILLGKTQIRLGNGGAAEKELRRALKLGAAPSEVLVLLGNALLLQKKYQDLIDSVAPDARETDSVEVRTLRGRAFLELGRLDEAERELRAAMALDPGRAEPLLAMANLDTARGRLDDAERNVDRAIEIAPKNAEVWFEKGERRYAARDFSGALSHYSRAIDIVPGHMRARLSRAMTHLALDRPSDAIVDAEFVRSRVTGDVKAAVILAQARARAGDAAGARTAFAEASSELATIKEGILTRDAELLRIAALLSFINGDYEKAHRYLVIHRTLRKNDPAVGVLLGRIKLALGDGGGAIEILYPLYRASPNDTELMLLLGEAYLRARRYGEASAMFERALALMPEAASVRTQFALSKLGVGRSDVAIPELERALDLDTRHDTSAGILLTLVHVRRGDHDAALRTATALVDAAPDNPVFLNLLGAAELGAGRVDDARRTFERALAAVPDFEPAAYNLAVLDMRAGKLGAARARFKAIVDANPRAADAMTGLAEIALITGKLKPARAWLDKAIGVDPTTVEPQLRLVELQLREGDAAAALRTADDLVTRFPNLATAVLAQARAQAALGRKGDARQSFQHAATHAGAAGAILLQIAEAQQEMKDYGGARATLENAMDTAQAPAARAARLRLDLLSGDFDAAVKHAAEIGDGASAIDAGVALAMQQLQRGETDAALATANGLLTRQRRNPALLNLVGTVYLHDAKRSEARSWFERALAAQPHFEPALYNLAALELQAGDRAEAARWLEQIAGRNAHASAAMVRLGDIARADGRLSDARRWMEKAAAAEPEAAFAGLRLVAFLLQNGDTPAALTAAEGLGGRFPNRADVLAALARAQAAAGRLDDARTNYRRAVTHGETDGGLLLEIAKAQESTGDLEGARVTLDRAQETTRARAAYGARVNLEMAAGDLDQALAHAEAARNDMPGTALGDVLVGDVLMATKRYAPALAAYEAGWGKERTREAVLGLYSAHSALGRAARGLEILAAWVQGHPDDLLARRALAIGYLVAGRLDAAQAQHESLLAAQPDDSMLLANLARMYQLKRDARALPTAKQAYKLAPQSAVALDTFGWILVTNGEPERGLKLLREAASRDGSLLIRYHVAAALSELGRSAEARAELQIILSDETESDLTRAARTLSEQLAKGGDS